MGSREKGEVEPEEVKEKIFQIFKGFMTRVGKLEELWTVGSRLLNGFQQGLEFIRRPPVDKTSALIESILKANETKRVKAYVAAGCVNNHDRTLNMSKSKVILNELEKLLDDLTVAIQVANGYLPILGNEEFNEQPNLQATIDQEEAPSLNVQLREITNCAVLMGIVYSMVKEDYEMQERIVTGLNLKSISEELESYCLMWSLRPFIDDEIMQKAWRLVL